MPKLLAVSCWMPPILTPRSLQVARTLKCLADTGWQCTVLTVDPQSLRRGAYFVDPSLESIYRNAYQQVRTRSLENRWPFLALRRLYPRFALPGGTALLGRKVLWAPSAIQAGKRLLEGGGDFSVIVSFAMPWSSHLVGQALWRASRLPWVAHFSDSLVDPYFRGGPVSRRIARSLERSIVRDADVLVFVTQRAAGLVLRGCPAEWRRKVRIVPHGYDDDLGQSIGAAGKPGAALRLVYTGTFYGPRTPAPLLRALAALDGERPLGGRLEVTFIGSNPPDHQLLSERLGLGKVVRFYPGRTYIETLRAIAAADVCLIIDAPSDSESIFLPSKLMDYVMLRKPILGLTPDRGESADLLRALDCPVVAPDDVPAIAEAIERLLRTRPSGSPRVSSEYEQVAAQYDVRQTTRLLDGALRAALHETAKSSL